MSAATKNEWLYFVEVSGYCNLRCPSCPNANFTTAQHPRGFITPDLFAAIAAKIRRECPADDIYIALYNWGEPLLHPELPRLVRLAREQGLLPLISTNLLADADLDALIQSQPHWIRVSLSGLSSATYGKTHFPGDARKLIRNLRRLKTRWDALGGGFPVHLYFHKYAGNLGKDRDRAQALARELGFGYDETWAMLTPWEKLLEYYGGRADPKCSALVDLLALRPEDARAVALKLRPQHPDCLLRSRQTTIDFDGRLTLCCGVFDSANYLAAGFLDLPHEAIQRLKYAHPLCTECMRNGVDIIATHPGLEGFDQAVRRRVERVNR
jgi:hypothetical protein